MDVPSQSRMDPARMGAGRRGHRAHPGRDAGLRSGVRVAEPGLSPLLCMLAAGTGAAGWNAKRPTMWSRGPLAAT
jgi:hypothetical protein